MCCDLFFSDESAALVKNKKQYFLTQKLVQCLDHAQPECLRAKVPAGWLKAKKTDSESGICAVQTVHDVLLNHCSEANPSSRNTPPFSIK